MVPLWCLSGGSWCFSGACLVFSGVSWRLSGASLVVPGGLWCLSGASLVVPGGSLAPVWCSPVAHGAFSDASLVLLWCVSGASLMSPDVRSQEPSEYFKLWGLNKNHEPEARRHFRKTKP